MVTPTTLKRLQNFARMGKYGLGLTGNAKGLSERAKLDLASAGLIENGGVNPQLYFVSAKGHEVLAWAQRPIFPAKQ